MTCPVAVSPTVSEAEKELSHAQQGNGNRVQARYADAETGKPVDDDDKVEDDARQRHRTEQIP